VRTLPHIGFCGHFGSVRQLVRDNSRRCGESDDRSTSLVMKGSPVRVRASALRLLQGFCALDGGLNEGLRGLPGVYLVKCSRRKSPFCRPFSSSETSSRVSSPVTSSSLESRLTPSAVLKGQVATKRVFVPKGRSLGLFSRSRVDRRLVRACGRGFTARCEPGKQREQQPLEGGREVRITVSR
jgi:hypothetical protein